MALRLDTGSHPSPTSGSADSIPAKVFESLTSPSPRLIERRVHAFFDVAVSVGAEVLHEPRLWPEYHDNYYGAFVRDPDGNNVEAVCHAPESP